MNSTDQPTENHAEPTNENHAEPTNECENLAPMERQGILTQELARAVIVGLNLSDDWRSVTAAFIPDDKSWAARIVITHADGSDHSGDTRFGYDSHFTVLLVALQESYAEQKHAFVSMKLTAWRNEDNLDRISVSTEVNYDQDPGSFDGVGGVDQQTAAHLVQRFGVDHVPDWVRERAVG